MTLQWRLESLAKMQHAEKLFFSEDILDASLAMCLAPIHVAQLLVSSTRADIRNCFVTPTTKLQKICTILFVFLVTISFYYFVLCFIEKFSSVPSEYYYAPIASMSMIYVTFAVNICNARFFKSEKSVRLYLMLQKVDRLLKLDDTESMNQLLYACLITVVPLSLILQIVGSLVVGWVMYGVKEKVIFGLPYNICIVVVYFDLLLCASSIWYIRVRLQFLNTVIRYNVMNYENTQRSDSLWELKERYKIKDEHCCEGLKMVMTTFKNILNTFQLISELFQVSVSTYIDKLISLFMAHIQSFYS